jgi:outer membrane protein assembly factor BamB
VTDPLHVVVVLLTLLLSQRAPDTGPYTQFAGTWSGDARYGNESAPLVITLEPAENGSLRGFFSNPIIHLSRVPLGAVKLSNRHLAVGPLDLDYDNRQDTLTTTLPEAIVPVHEMTVIFHRSSPVPAKPRPEIAAPVREPAWTHEVGSPIWGDTLVSGGLVVVGSDDGALHALDAKTGKERWVFRAAGAVRARPTRVADDVVFQADDGMLYRVGLADGVERWRVRVADRFIARLSLGDPKTRYENAAAAVATSNNRLFLGTHEGHVLALDARDGARVWDTKTDDSVVASPLVSGDRIIVGSFDGRVYALDAATGAKGWTFDTHAPVTSTAAAFDGTVIVGSRSYDLFALDATQGRPVWSRYFWFSWVESPATIYQDVAYIGSSDAAALHAFDARSGRTVWRLDVGGSAWAQPVVTDTTVYEGTTGVTNYLLDHRAAMIAVDRQTGQPVWRYSLPVPTAGQPQEMVAYGFAGSAALADGLIVAGGIDGRVYAFRE